MQKLNYFLEENEKEEIEEEKKQASNSSFVFNSEMKNEKNKFVRIKINSTRKKSSKPKLCEKFKKNPFRFFTESPSDSILKMCNFNLNNSEVLTNLNKKYFSNSGSKIKNKKKENSSSQFDEPTIYKIKE